LATTFQKRQKEMKRIEKQRMKAERRAQRKSEKTSEPGAGAPIEHDDSFQNLDTDADESSEES